MKTMPKSISFEKLKKDLMENPKFRYEYEKLEPEFQIAKQMMAARIKQEISQEEVARKAHTGQAVISRLEGMNAKPSISLLTRIARALNIQMQITVG